MRKKCITLILALVLLMSVCIVPALADGFYDIGTAAGVTVAAQDKDGAAISSTTDHDGKAVYDDSVKLGVTLTGATAGAQYLVMLAAANDVTGITKDTLLYVDQVEATGSSVSFSVYPILKEGDLTLFVTSDDGTTNISLPVSYFIDKPAFTLGDIDNDGYIDSYDASLAMQYEVGLIDDARIASSGLIIEAGDVSGDGEVDSWDASQIMQYEVELITDWIKD